MPALHQLAQLDVGREEVTPTSENQSKLGGGRDGETAGPQVGDVLVRKGAQCHVQHKADERDDTFGTFLVELPNRSGLVVLLQDCDTVAAFSTRRRRARAWALVIKLPFFTASAASATNSIAAEAAAKEKAMAEAMAAVLASAASIA